jgi:hypothetical protein
MIHSLEDKNKKELVEICKIQIEEYQLLEKEVAELKLYIKELEVEINEYTEYCTHYA